MFKRHNEPAEGTIVEQRVTGHAPDSGLAAAWEYVVDVRPATGAPFRTTVQMPKMAMDFAAPGPGQVVKVLVDAKHESAVFDKSDPALSRKAHKRERDARFEAAQHAAPGEPRPSVAGAGVPGGLEGWRDMSPEQLMEAATAAGLAGKAWAPGAPVPGAPAPGAPQPAQRTTTQRLQELQALRDQDLITAEEFERRRQEIIAEV